jgi:hypothetical protein
VWQASPSDELGPVDLSMLNAAERADLADAVPDGTAAAGCTINHVGLLYARLYLAPYSGPPTSLRRVSDFLGPGLLRGLCRHGALSTWYRGSK